MTAGLIMLVASMRAGADEVRAQEDTEANAAAVQDLPPGESVEFGRDIRPLLERSCLACHSANTAEADVVLESPESMLAYGADDPLVVPGDPSAGKLLSVAAGLQEPIMPPADNEVGAVRWTPADLGKMKRWIELGARGDRSQPSDQPIHWRPIPPDRAPIIATAVTSRGTFALAAIGNAVEVYNLAANRHVASLVDASLGDVHSGFAGAAHFDAVRSLATFDNGERIATGGYRAVKLWRRDRTKQALSWPATEPASALAASPSGEWIATGHADGSAVVGRRGAASSQNPPVRWDAHDDKIVALSFQSSGDQLLTVAADGSVRRWRMPSLERLGDYKVAPLRTAELLAGGILAATSDDLFVQIYRLPDAQEQSPDKKQDKSPPAALKSDLQLRGHGREITSLAAVADQQLLVSGSRDGFVRLWDIDAGAEKRSWIHGKAVVAVAAEKDGASFISIDEAGVAKMWSADQDEPAWTAAVDDRSAQRLNRAEQSLKLARGNIELFQKALEAARQQQNTDRERLASAESSLAEKEKALAEAQTAAEAARTQHEAAVLTSKKATDLAAAAQKMRDALQRDLQNVVAATSELDTVLQQAASNPDGDLADAESVKESPTGDAGDPAGEPQSDATLEQVVGTLTDTLGEIRNAQTHRDQLHQRLAELTTMLKARVASPEQIEQLARQAKQADERVAAAQTAASDAKDSRRRAKEGAENAQRVVQQAEQRLAAATKTLESRRHATSSLQADLGPASPVVAAGFSDDGQQVLMATRSGVASVFHADGRPQEQWHADAGDLTCAQLAGKGEVIALSGGSPESLTIWNTQPKWRLEQTLGGPNDATTLLEDRVLALEFSPDGRLLAIGGGAASGSGQVIVWNLEDDRLHCQLERPHDDAVLGLSFSHDGQYLATASADRMMKAFNVRDGSYVRLFEGHTHHVLDVAWRANGLQLATASADKSIKIWNFDRGEQVRTLLGAGKEITGVEFLGISSHLVAAAGDGAARVYNADDGQAVRTISAGGDYLMSCDVTDSGELVVTAGVQRILRAHNISDGAERNAFAVPQATREDP